MKDICYYYDKLTYEKYELGEIQTNFNMSFVIDGTKDSSKIIVDNFVEGEVEPYTIIKHELTNTWWIVVHDKVERYENESTPLYRHNLQILGAIELLNARDLTDCAFRDNRYTIEQTFNRLLSLSNLEFYGDNRFDITLGVGQTQLDTQKIIDYVKTYENNTLLSAIRDLFNGYNISIKLSFNEEINLSKWGNDKYHLCALNFELISKTGNGNIISNTLFSDVRETKTMDKNSFGTTVVSNAENVISTQAKTFPTIGTARLTGVERTIINNKALLRLPSNIFDVNWLMICRSNFKFHVNLTLYFPALNISPITFDEDINYIYGNPHYNDSEFQKIIDSYNNNPYLSQTFIDNVTDYLNSQKDFIFSLCEKACRTTLYNCDRYNPYNDNFIAPDNNSNFYFPIIEKQYGTNPISYHGKAVLTPKEVKDTSLYGNYCSIGWERDKPYIENFEMIGGADVLDHTRFVGYESTDLRDNTYNNNYVFINETIYGETNETAYLYINLQDSDTLYLKINSTSFVINYIPMSDLKIKYDNAGNRVDTQLYNQNGKLTDSNALSKRLLSYSKEIESDNITKYAQFRNFNSVPKVGDIVPINNIPYVINNVSLTFYQNEINSNNVNDKGYKIDCEFTMSKKIAVKSLMVNPNTNIRDYGIPQNNSVYRKQLYRDFYELAHTHDSGADNNCYLSLSKVLNVGHFYEQYAEHIAVMKITYGEEFGGDPDYNIDPQDIWYYQLDTSCFILKKSIYEVINFKDNNIIGYSSLNVSSAFDVSKLLTGLHQMVNTPVSYVDDNGNFKKIEIAMCNTEQLSEIYTEYQQENNISEDIMNASCFIDEKIFEGESGVYQGAKQNNDFLIVEEEYYKDALEVPMFEYSCQIDDSDDVVIGDNILEQYSSDFLYMYTYILVEKNSINENNWNSLDYERITQDNLHPQLLNQVNTIKFDYIEESIPNYDTQATQLRINFYKECTYNIIRNEITYTDPLDYDINDIKGYDIVIIRNTIAGSRGVSNQNQKHDLVCVIKNTENSNFATDIVGGLILYTNHYKIK